MGPTDHHASIEANRQAVTQALVRQLQISPGAKVRFLAAQIGTSKTLCNSVLYGNKSLFEGVGDMPPSWYLRAGANPKAQPAVEIDVDVGADPPEPYTSSAPFGIALYEWQEAALQAWTAAEWQGIVEAVTGAGKTMIGVRAIADHLTELGPQGRAAVIVPTVELLHQWCAVFEDFLPAGFSVGRLGAGYHDDLTDHDVLVAVANSARQSALGLPEDCRGLLVADECHRYGSAVNQLALEPEFQDRLGLSATYERPDGAHETVLLPYFGQVIYTLDYAQAIDEGVVAGVRVATVGVDLSAEERERYDAYAVAARKARTSLVFDFGAPKEPFGEFMSWANEVAKGPKGHHRFLARSYLKNWQAKRAVLAQTPAKTAALTLLVPALQDADRSLVFTNTIDSADEIAEALSDLGIRAESHHSQIPKKDRVDVLDRFRSGRLDVVVAAMTLNEGVDVPEADLAVVVAASSQRREMIQRMGRVLRLKPDGRDARFVIVYARETPEDPNLGAHEEFFDSLLDVAREIEDFDTADSPADIAFFLAP